MKIKFITYGNGGYEVAVKRLLLQAEYIDYFNECSSESDSSIIGDAEFSNVLKSNPDFWKVFNQNKGGGYWLWKPYIIHKHLLKLNEGDLLYYADAGCTLSIKTPTERSRTLKKLKKYSSRINDSTQGVQILENRFLEKEFTKREVFDFFEAATEKSLYNTNQFGCGRHLVKKCRFSMGLYKEWWDIAKSHPQLFADQAPNPRNFSSFRGHRHDQSVWSLLCKTNKVNDCLERFTTPEDFKTNFPFRLTRIRGGRVPQWLLDWAQQ